MQPIQGYQMVPVPVIMQGIPSYAAFPEFNYCNPGFYPIAFNEEQLSYGNFQNFQNESQLQPAGQAQPEIKSLKLNENPAEICESKQNDKPEISVSHKVPSVKIEYSQAEAEIVPPNQEEELVSVHSIPEHSSESFPCSEANKSDDAPEEEEKSYKQGRRKQVRWKRTNDIALFKELDAHCQRSGETLETVLLETEQGVKNEDFWKTISELTNWHCKPEELANRFVRLCRRK